MAPRIGITQRVEGVPGREEVRDCLDQNWARLLDEVGMLPVPLANAVVDPGRYAIELRLDGVIFSGGNDLGQAAPGARNVSPERDRFESAMLAHCAAAALPALGVCRGMQLMCHAQGAALVAVEGHVATRHDVIVQSPAPGFWPARMEVNSFHGYGVREIPGGPLRALARDVAGNIEAVAHERLPQFGIMWHPEREKRAAPFDVALLLKLFAG